MNDFELYRELRRIFIEWPDIRISFQWDPVRLMMDVELTGPGCSHATEVPKWLWAQEGSRGEARLVYRGWLAHNPEALTVPTGVPHPRYGLRTDGVAVSVPERTARASLRP